MRDRSRKKQKEEEGDGSSRNSAPGKKAMELQLNDGASIASDAATFGKKDLVSFSRIQPEARHRYLPHLRDQEALLSEIYLVTWSNEATVKKPINVKIPFHEEHFSVRMPRIRVRKPEGDEWSDLTEFEIQTKYVHLEVSEPRLLCLISFPRQELFNVPTAGVLYNAKINKFVSIRFPKRVVDRPVEVGIKIDQIDQNRLESIKLNNHRKCGEVLHRVSEFIDIRPERQLNFKRNVTVKLPLPAHEESEFDPNNATDMTVLQQNAGGWEIIEGPHKFTRQIVSIDVKYLGRYCVALSKPGKFRRLPDAIAMIEDQNQKAEGEAFVFVKYETKKWTMALEVSENERENEIVRRWTDRGYSHIAREEEFTVVNGDDHETAEEQNSRSWRSKKKVQSNGDSSNNRGPLMPLSSHCHFTFEASGDVWVRQQSDEDNSKDFSLHYNENLKENSRTFILEPHIGAAKDMEGTITFFTAGNMMTRKRAQTTRITIDEALVEQYFAPDVVTPPPEEKPELPDVHVPTERSPSPPRTMRFEYVPRNPASYSRLMKPTRIPIHLDKEPRVLSGKSLKALAAAIPQGLTLAVHLNLSDSSITGIGFDALSNGLGLADVTYKILMYWKRMCKGSNGEKINELIKAYTEMGQLELADLISEKEDDNHDILLEEAVYCARQATVTIATSNGV